MYDVDLVEESIEELRGLRANERRRVLDEIDQQLRANPAMVTRRRKMLVGVIPPWDQVRPVWQLRVGDLLLTMGNPRFWEMIESRRRSRKTFSMGEVRRRLRVPKKTEGRRARSRERDQR